MTGLGYTSLVDTNAQAAGLLFLNGVDLRADLLAAEALVSGERYTFFRSFYLQRREYLISDGVVEDEFDDDFDDLKLGQLVTTHFNLVCTLKDDDGNEVTDETGQPIQASCPNGTDTREPIHPACSGDEALRDWLENKCPINPTNSKQRHPACPSDESLGSLAATGIDETNQIKINYLPVVPGLESLSKVQRLRLEVDYKYNEIRLYASKYAEKISTEGTGLPEADITNPTNCEKQGILDDLVYAERDNEDFDGVRLSALIDTGYDTTYKLDGDGNQEEDADGNLIIEAEPNPIFTFHFQGTAITNRQ
mgnify:CR=1 FL=1